MPGGLRAFGAAGWTRPNWRGTALPFPAGVLAVAATLVALGPLAALDALGVWDVLGPAGVAGIDPVGAALLLGFGVAFLGLLDDLLAAEPRGWRGHGAAVLRGGFSTGALKAAGTVALALAALGGAGLPAGEYLLAVLVVVLATNLFNLLDLRPGRSVKAFALLAAGLLAGTATLEPLRGIGLFAGPLLVVGAYDLRERAMLGDTGSNLLGAMAGLWLVLALDTAGQAVAAALMAALTIFGEFRSLTAAIDRVPPLRALDSLGRRSDA
jgi:UDP-GlcNAc:undecaprenyl-phosphate/decaprenyl-phosphate GlcNAc-1-phosphate transferase